MSRRRRNRSGGSGGGTSTPCTWRRFFARSMPTVVAFILVAPFSVVDSHLHCGTLMPYQKGATIPLASAASGHPLEPFVDQASADMVGQCPFGHCHSTPFGISLHP